MTTVNPAEVVSYYARNGMAETGIRGMLAELPIEYVAPDEALAYEIGLLHPATRAAGLSLGDRACLAVARRLGVPAITADRAWSKIAGVAIETIR